MKMSEAMKIINRKIDNGYLVHFEEVVTGGNHFKSYFPDKEAEENLIKTEDEAWDLAKKFAARVTGIYVNVYVVDSNLEPVEHYRNKMLNER